MTSDLLTINEVIAKARQEGVSFGFARPKTRLAYLTRLRLLPQTIRRKFGNKIAGCYPAEVVATLKNIERLKAEGLSFSQIRHQLATKGKGVRPTLSPTPNLAFLPAGNGLAFLFIGLILGYLLAVSDSHAIPVTPASSQATAQAIPTEAKILQATLNQAATSEPIYVIALPKQNLYKIGQIDLNGTVK